MNINMTCLKADDVRTDLAEVGTAWPQRFLMRILACCLIGVMCAATILWLGMMLAQFVHFVYSVS